MPVRPTKTSPTVRTSAVESKKPTARTSKANAAQLSDKVRQASRPPRATGAQHAAAARSVVAADTSAEGAIEAGLGRLRNLVIGFHQHGRVSCPNPQAVDTKQMAANLTAIVNRELPAQRFSLSLPARVPAALQQQARDTATAVYKETRDLVKWIYYYGGASADTDLREEHFGKPLRELGSIVDELRTTAARWGGVEARGGVDQMTSVVRAPKFIDHLRADAKMLGAQLAQVPPKASAVAKAEAKMMKTLEPLLAILQDPKVMADVQLAIKNDFWRSGNDVFHMADAVRMAMFEVGYAYGASEHFRGWHSYVVGTMDNLKSQRLNMPIHEQGPSPSSSKPLSWYDDPSIPAWRR